MMKFCVFSVLFFYSHGALMGADGPKIDEETTFEFALVASSSEVIVKRAYLKNKLTLKLDEDTLGDVDPTASFLPVQLSTLEIVRVGGTERALYIYSGIILKIGTIVNNLSEQKIKVYYKEDASIEHIRHMTESFIFHTY